MKILEGRVRNLKVIENTWEEMHELYEQQYHFRLETLLSQLLMSVGSSGHPQLPTTTRHTYLLLLKTYTLKHF